MQIRIDLGSTQPLTGAAWLDGLTDPVPFAGWLELISAIERLVEAGRNGPSGPADPEEVRPYQSSSSS